MGLAPLPPPLPFSQQRCPSACFPVGARFPHPSDCSQVQQNSNVASGLYTIYLHVGMPAAPQVYCDMDTDGGGWTVSHTEPWAVSVSQPRELYFFFIHGREMFGALQLFSENREL